VHQSGHELSDDGAEEGKTIRLQINHRLSFGDTTMKKIALITALVIGTASVAFAEDGFDPNLANRYPGYAAPKSHSMTTRNVGLGSGSGSSSSSWTATQSPTFDRASNPNAGGV
jgi:hypothetical protein